MIAIFGPPKIVSGQNKPTIRTTTLLMRNYFIAILASAISTRVHGDAIADALGAVTSGPTCFSQCMGAVPTSNAAIQATCLGTALITCKLSSVYTPFDVRIHELQHNYDFQYMPSQQQLLQKTELKLGAACQSIIASTLGGSMPAYGAAILQPSMMPAAPLPVSSSTATTGAVSGVTGSRSLSNTGTGSPKKNADTFNTTTSGVESFEGNGWIEAVSLLAFVLL
ncbi:hypothetical protein BC830DRAFT_1085792 [Chytriomyces sp. MP71]|nr:hypothetical protein BC830DRAFT_1085792 [Chytriomyces sp. MP71]